MDLIGTLLIGVLLLQSTLGLAILFDAILYAGLKREQTLESLTVLHVLAKSWHSLSPSEQADRRKRVQVRHLATAFDLMVHAPGLAPHAEHHVHRWLQSLDGNVTNLKQLLTKTAPLIGLAGTLAGISSSMGRFEQRVSDPGVIVHGFSVAIETTLYGIFVSCFCLLADRLFWRPLKEQARELWLEIETVTALDRKKSEARSTDATATTVQRLTTRRDAEPRGLTHGKPSAQRNTRRKDATGELQSLSGPPLTSHAELPEFRHDEASPPGGRTRTAESI